MCLQLWEEALAARTNSLNCRQTGRQSFISSIMGDGRMYGILIQTYLRWTGLNEMEWNKIKWHTGSLIRMIDLQFHPHILLLGISYYCKVSWSEILFEWVVCFFWNINGFLSEGRVRGEERKVTERPDNNKVCCTYPWEPTSTSSIHKSE